MKEKKKSAPPATEKTPGTLEPEPETAPTEAQSAAVVPETVSPIQIPPKVLEQAKALGIDLKQIVDWAQNVEARLVAADQNFQKIGGFLERMEPLIKLSEQVQQAQANPQTQVPQGGGLNLGSLMQFLPQLMGGGGGDSEFIELAKESMRADIGFTKALKSAVISKITGGATTEIAKAATGE